MSLKYVIKFSFHTLAGDWRRLGKGKWSHYIFGFLHKQCELVTSSKVCGGRLMLPSDKGSSCITYRDVCLATCTLLCSGLPIWILTSSSFWGFPSCLSSALLPVYHLSSGQHSWDKTKPCPTLVWTRSWLFSRDLCLLLGFEWRQQRQLCLWLCLGALLFFSPLLLPNCSPRPPS